jgi:2-polyprenyl-3-methyl-5-hydroxy-6-metoxy-1,4-benzoquinol methylase
MSANQRSELQIVESWTVNAIPWANAVRERKIESRRLVTDAAIVDLIRHRAPKSILDMGCGEGWLARALASDGIEIHGIDAVPALIEEARKAGGGSFQVLSYEEIAAGRLRLAVDLIVCNFCLFGKESVELLLRALAPLLHPNGAVMIQTLHPLLACAELPYQSGWREGTWAGIDGAFSQPAPWYFRTVESWIELFQASGLRLTDVREPLSPKTLKPVSMIFVAGAEGGYLPPGAP